MSSSALLWDTCVVYRWFNGIPREYLDHIEKYLEESDIGKREIYISTITLAEIRPSAVGKTGLSPNQVLSAMNKSFVLVDPTPDIMSLAGHLRDQKFRHTSMPDSKAAHRTLSLGDSVHLSTAVALREEFGVQGLSLHSFDQGKSKDAETGKKTVPIVGFESWCRDCSDDEEIQKVINLPRKKPEHPLCPLPKTNPN